MNLEKRHCSGWHVPEVPRRAWRASLDDPPALAQVDHCAPNAPRRKGLQVGGTSLRYSEGRGACLLTIPAIWDARYHRGLSHQQMLNWNKTSDSRFQTFLPAHGFRRESGFQESLFQGDLG